MDKKEFWRLIDEMKKEKDSEAWIVDTLSKRPIEDIIAFQLQVEYLLQRGFRSELWGAAYVIMGGCSDDAFESFRAWLIYQGESVFEETLKDPEYLATHLSEIKDGEEFYPEYEQLLEIALDAYFYKHNESIEWDEELSDEFYQKLAQKDDGKTKVEIDFEWEDEEDLIKQFPKLWSKFGKQ